MKEICRRNTGGIMDFHLFRLSLKRTSNLFEYSPSDAVVDREEWLRFAFSKRFPFLHRGQEFYYVPIPDAEREAIDGRLIAGWIAKSVVSKERLSPDEGLAVAEHSSWVASFIAIDPSHHDDGQKLAVENAPHVGKPGAIVKSLVSAISHRGDAPYETLVYPILEKGSFWKFAEEHQNKIRSMSFTLVAPNMFGGKEDLQRELRDLRDSENVSEVKTTLKSDTSLNPDTKRMHEVVDYTEQGAGKLTAKTVDGVPYTSEQHAAKRTVDVEPHAQGKVREFIRQIGAALDRIF